MQPSRCYRQLMSDLAQAKLGIVATQKSPPKRAFLQAGQADSGQNKFICSQPQARQQALVLPQQGR
jgi:hypothetical protein